MLQYYRINRAKQQKAHVKLFLLLILLPLILILILPSHEDISLPSSDRRKLLYKYMFIMLFVPGVEQSNEIKVLTSAAAIVGNKKQSKKKKLDKEKPSLICDFAKEQDR